MLGRFFDKVYRAKFGPKLEQGAVKSLEYAMIVMLVAVASLGAVNTPALHAAQPHAAPLQLASAN